MAGDRRTARQRARASPASLFANSRSRAATALEFLPAAAWTRRIATGLAGFGAGQRALRAHGLRESPQVLDRQSLFTKAIGLLDPQMPRCCPGRHCGFGPLKGLDFGAEGPGFLVAAGLLVQARQALQQVAFVRYAWNGKS